MKFVGKLNAKDDRIAELEKMLEDVKASSKKAIAAERSACDLRVYNRGIDAMVEAYVKVQPTALSEVMEQLQMAATVSLTKRREEILGGNVYMSTIANLDEAMSTNSDD